MPPRTLSAGAVVLRQESSGWRFLMLRAFRNWDFPKGVVENGETPLAAAVREVAEETFIEDLDFAWGEIYIETGPYSRNKVARYYLARTSTSAVSLPFNPEIGRPEHSEYRWVSHAEALALAAPRVQRVIRWAAAQLGLPEEHSP